MKNTLLFATLLLSTSCALAGNAYIGVNAGSAEQKVSTSLGSASDEAFGFKAYGGYQVDANVGMEAGYVRFGEATGSALDVTIGAKSKSVYAALTGAMPASAYLNVFVKLGIVRTETDVHVTNACECLNLEESRNSRLLGVGVQYKFSDTMSLVGEYENYGKVIRDGASGIDLKPSLVSVGVRIAF